MFRETICDAAMKEDSDAPMYGGICNAAMDNDCLSNENNNAQRLRLSNRNVG